MLKTILKFAFGNGKLSNMTAIFDLPAGHSCPFAKACLSKADRKTGVIIDGPENDFRCYAASLEAVFKGARDNRWANFEAMIKMTTVAQLTDYISKQLPEALRYRIHSSGDFFKQSYFDAWLNVARLNPDRIFYAYTKALPFWIARLDSIPANVKLIASYGGTHDDLIAKHGLRFAKVFPTVKAATAAGLKVDYDDSLAYGSNDSFALLIHGTQRAGSKWAKAWQILKAAKMKLKGKGK